LKGVRGEVPTTLAATMYLYLGTNGLKRHFQGKSRKISKSAVKKSKFISLSQSLGKNSKML
jgi:hypothetical protein